MIRSGLLQSLSHLSGFFFPPAFLLPVENNLSDCLPDSFLGSIKTINCTRFAERLAFPQFTLCRVEIALKTLEGNSQWTIFFLLDEVADLVRKVARRAPGC